MSDGTTRTTVSDESALRSALNTANANIVLDSAIKSITIDDGTSVNIADGVTLDLNYKQIIINKIDKESNSNRLIVADGATVNIQNGTIVYNKTTGSADDKSPIRVGLVEGATSANNSTLTLNNVNITSADYGVAVFSKANLNVTNSNIISVNSAISTNGTIASKDGNSCGSNIVINGGQYTSTDTAAIYFPGGDKLNVTGGTFTGKTGFDIRSGTVIINNATINVFGSPNEVKSGDGPTNWGMGIAVFNRASYGQNSSGEYTELNITFTATINNAVYNVYIGDYHIDSDGTLKTSDLSDHEFSQIPHAVKLNNESKDGIVLEKGIRDVDTLVPLTINIDKRIFANGNAITISKGANDCDSKIIFGSSSSTTFVDKFDLSSFSIFGGSKNKPVTSTSITMTGGNVAYLYGGGYGTSESTKADVTGTANISVTDGTLTTIYGGGLLYSTVANSSISMTGGTTNFIMGGGACSVTGMSSPGTSENPYTTISEKASITISGGTATYVMGGGQGYSHVNNAEINISGNTTRITELIAGGSNGSTSPTASINIDNGNIEMVFSVNRGLLKDPTITVNGGKITNLYVGASQNSSNTTGSVTGKATLNITGGEIADIYLGTGLDNADVELNLRTTDKVIAAGGHEHNGDEEFTKHNSSNYDVVKTYTISNEKTWTITGGLLDISKATLTNNGELKLNNLAVNDDGLIIKNIQGSGKLEIKDTTFEKKGLYIYKANDVTIKGCTFTGITESVVDGDSTIQVNAIYLENCTGDVIIGGEMEDDKNAIENVSSSDSTLLSQYGRGIFISYGGSGKSLTIQNNLISGTAYNALQLSNIEFTEITISNNEINNWDSDNDGIEDRSDGTPDFSKGRAIRLNVNEGNSTTLTISDNKFTKTYTAGILYDNYNIIKISDADAEFTNNILVLSGLNNTTNNPDLFMTGTESGSKKIVIFNPTDGYFKDSSGTNELLYSITENGVVDEPTDPSRLGSYSFAGWYTDSTLTAPFTDFTVPINGDKTLYAKWTYTGGSGGYPVNPPVTPDTPEEPIIPDSSGNAEIKVDDKKADELVHETVASGSNTLSIVDKDNVEGTVTSVSISVSDLETISKKIENNNNIDSISIATSEGEVIIEKEVLAEILENNSEADTLIIEVNNAENKLTEEQKKVVGDNPVYDINLRLGDKYVTSFNGKSITVSIPYELKEGEDQNNLIVYYLKDDGSIEKMNCSYKDNQVSFETNHLSKFIIVYEAQEPIVPDNPDDKNDDNNSDNTIYYIIAAVIIILIIIALAYYFMKK